jgi:hypothetical protein
LASQYLAIMPRRLVWGWIMASKGIQKGAVWWCDQFSTKYDEDMQASTLLVKAAVYSQSVENWRWRNTSRGTWSLLFQPFLFSHYRSNYSKLKTSCKFTFTLVAVLENSTSISFMASNIWASQVKFYRKLWTSSKVIWTNQNHQREKMWVWHSSVASGDEFLW